jgi:hypothetical protein
MPVQRWVGMVRARKETIAMSAMLPPEPHLLETPQMYSSLRSVCHPVTAEPELENPKVLTTGDIKFYVTESEAVLHPVVGHYSIETPGLQEPLYMLWHAEGQVLCRQARSTSVAFDVRGARAGETRIYLVAVQVMESGAQGRVVQSGMFVQVVVTGDDLLTTPWRDYREPGIHREIPGGG